ncbi:MAG: hypothetical protein QW507_00780 [Candidatus Nanoarchaeia archaeon]|nr:hypothetical protein [Candidatus Haiyanarchaeum thermophilum]MCW1302885.1 hypothetical protein [Candidatus Haiyanarchaeum thermophilum]MCW1303564.1 hypothetical protein [Candidatus Haiyanarchaeum thermophilum]MCW1306246.1 hypothetical protein [Candidatus Haiyanarchaeum thermophilum]MCW1307518.1 hypothetical protein [Candidatus Haiyanarchaeum thermophilum]
MIEIALISLQTLALGLGYWVGRRNEGEIIKNVGLFGEVVKFIILTLASFELVCLIAENRDLILTTPIFIVSAWIKQKYSVRGEEIGIPILLSTWIGMPSLIILCLLLNLLRGSLIYLRRGRIERAMVSLTLIAILARAFLNFSKVLGIVAVMLII